MPRPKLRPVVVLLQNPTDAAMYAEFLRHHAVEVLCPETVDDAFERAKRANVVVTELAVPDVADGVALIQRLRADCLTKRIPILVVTSWAWQTERLRAQDAGCDVFLTKPCLPEDLLRKIRGVLAMRKLGTRRGNAAKSSRTRH